MVRSGNFRMNIRGGLSSSFGDGRGNLGGLDLFFIIRKGRRQVVQSFPRGKSKSPVSQAHGLGCFGKFLHDFFVGGEGLFGFVVPAINLRQLHEKAKTVHRILSLQMIESLFIEAGSVFFFVQISIDVGTAFQDDVVLWKIFQELIDGPPGFRDGSRIGEKPGLPKAKPWKIGRFRGLGGIKILIKVPWEGAIEGISNKCGGPRERDLGLIGGLGKGKAREKSADKKANIRSKTQIGLLDRAHGGRHAPGEKGADPVFCGRANRIRTEGMNMIGDCALAEMSGG